jgi:putative SOS response-associated peptidase YedK
MCNLFTIKATKAEFLDYCEAIDGSRMEVEKPYASPGRPAYVIRVVEGARQLDVMKWGFPFQGKPVTNVRNYTSPFWRSALTDPQRRCLVPVTEFQEWSVRPDPVTGKKRAHMFSLPSRPVFCFAGIWRPAEDGPVFSFLTTGFDGDSAGHIVGAIHPKAIPVILHRENHERWLGAPVEDALGLATAFPSQLIAVA